MGCDKLHSFVNAETDIYQDSIHKGLKAHRIETAKLVCKSVCFIHRLF